jgi:hypothetical protein
MTQETNVCAIWDVVRRCLFNGDRHFAVRLPAGSYVGIDTLSVLLRCREAIARMGGTLSVVAPCQRIVDFFGQTDVGGKVRFCATEGELWDGRAGHVGNGPGDTQGAPERGSGVAADQKVRIDA